MSYQAKRCSELSFQSVTTKSECQFSSKAYTLKAFKESFYLCLFFIFSIGFLKEIDVLTWIQTGLKHSAEVPRWDAPRLLDRLIILLKVPPQSQIMPSRPINEKGF